MSSNSRRKLERAIPAEPRARRTLKRLAKNPNERRKRHGQGNWSTTCAGSWTTSRSRPGPPSLGHRAAKWTRRHQGVVASGVLITLIMVASLGWIGGDWQGRRAAAEARVVEALQTAEPLLLAGDPYVDSALTTATRRAEALLGSGVVGTELGQRVQQLLADQDMLVKLEEIRLSQAEVKDDHFDTSSADSAYARAFREYGIDVEALGLHEAATRICSRPIGVHLATALDNWRQPANCSGGQLETHCWN